MLAQVIRQTAETDGGEEVDREPYVLRSVTRHDALEVLRHARVVQAFIELAQTERLGELLEQNLDEDTR